MLDLMTVVFRTRKRNSLAQTLVDLAVNLNRDVKKRPFLPIWVDKEGSDAKNEALYNKLSCTLRRLRLTEEVNRRCRKPIP
jgi:hypothetical protein